LKYTDEFRDPSKARALLAAIETQVARTGATAAKPLHVMEICGGHTHAIFRYGLDKLTPDAIEFIHGPGCPVCVLPMSRVDDALDIAERPEVIFTTFGDAMRVPGTRGSLMRAKARGADIRMVYSPLDALELARRNPDRDVVFFGLGFETTMPSTALTLQQAAREERTNFSLFCNHILVPPPLKALLDDPDMALDGFVGPGHVSMVIGTAPYDFIARDYGKPLVVAGFEPLDLLQSVLMVVTQIAEGRAEIENQYARVVPREGNPAALAAMDAVFTPRDAFDWRGLGEIDKSGVKIRPEYRAFDAEEKFGVGYGAGKTSGREMDLPEMAGCLCGEVVKGKAKPWDCPKFGGACAPDTPLGALMVSSEGACAAYHLYADLDTIRASQ
jgi:hydrogenase expression/formation protein HypD